LRSARFWICDAKSSPPAAARSRRLGADLRLLRMLVGHLLVVRRLVMAAYLLVVSDGAGSPRDHRSP
jgi:hypothetical protein